MALPRFSVQAERDLNSIAIFTVDRWGVDQAIRYLDDLQSCCRQLAEMPSLGRQCDDIRPALHRLEHGKHVIFYRKQARGILVVRILHQSMLPGRI